MKAMKWIAKNSGRIINHTVIGAASIIGLTVLSTLVEQGDYDEFEGYGDEEMTGADGEQTIEVESEEVTAEEEKTEG